MQEHRSRRYWVLQISTKMTTICNQKGICCSGRYEWVKSRGLANYSSGLSHVCSSNSVEYSEGSAERIWWNWRWTPVRFRRVTRRTSQTKATLPSRLIHAVVHIRNSIVEIIGNIFPSHLNVRAGKYTDVMPRCTETAGCSLAHS